MITVIHGGSKHFYEKSEVLQFGLLDHFEGPSQSGGQRFEFNVDNIKWGRQDTDNRRRIFSHKSSRIILSIIRKRNTNPTCAVTSFTRIKLDKGEANQEK